MKKIKPKRGRPEIDPALRRVRISTSISPLTLEKLKYLNLDGSLGTQIDLAVGVATAVHREIQ